MECIDRTFVIGIGHLSYGWHDHNTVIPVGDPSNGSNLAKQRTFHLEVGDAIAFILKGFLFSFCLGSANGTRNQRPWGWRSRRKKWSHLLPCPVIDPVKQFLIIDDVGVQSWGFQCIKVLNWDRNNFCFCLIWNWEAVKADGFAKWKCRKGIQFAPYPNDGRYLFFAGLCQGIQFIHHDVNVVTPHTQI